MADKQNMYTYPGRTVTKTQVEDPKVQPGKVEELAKKQIKGEPGEWVNRN